MTTNNFPPPELYREYVCITSKDHVVLSALISNYFNNPGTYFIVLAFPDLATPFTGKSILGEDDYLAQTMGTQAAIRISDALAWLHPVGVFLAGMNEAQKSYIRAHMSDHKFIDVDGIEDIDQTLTFLSKNFDGVLACKASEIVQGLAMAKYANKRLLIDEVAPNLDDKYMHHGIGLVLIENNGTADEVVAVNYAFSIGADVAFVSPIRGNDILPVQEFIYKWKTHKSDSAYQQLRETLIERTDGINFFDYQFTTFFTLGFPYGLLLNNMIPFTHVLIHPGCDLFILNNIGSELIPGVASGALVFSPRLFQQEETDDVINILEKAGYQVKALLGEKATVSALEDYGEHFPFGMMHICSHGGETNGCYVIQEYLDRTGQQHKIEFEEIVGFSFAAGRPVVKESKKLFRKFDGFKWMSEELDKLPKYVFDDMMKALAPWESASNTAKRKRIDTPIYGSCHIECADSIHQGQFHSLACKSSPVIFNNTCSSWYEIAINFIAAGARAYLGTLWKVDNSVARDAAKVFYEHVLTKGNLLDSFYETTKTIQPAKYRNIYLYWGLHFSTVRSLAPKP